MEGGPLQTLEAEGSPEPERTDPPRIYVASLSDYNNGLLHGAWIDAAQEPEELQAGITAMLEASQQAGAEEWGVFDFTGFYGVDVGEWADLAWVSQIAHGIVEHGEAFARWAQVAGTDSEELSKFEAAYRGEWDNVEAYAEHLLEDFDLEAALDHAIPEALRSYVRIDSAALARDWQLNGELYASRATTGNVFVFDRTV